jgi:hypothetical protein
MEPVQAGVKQDQRDAEDGAGHGGCRAPRAGVAMGAAAAGVAEREQGGAAVAMVSKDGRSFVRTEYWTILHQMSTAAVFKRPSGRSEPRPICLQRISRGRALIGPGPVYSVPGSEVSDQERLLPMMPQLPNPECGPPPLNSLPTIQIQIQMIHDFCPSRLPAPAGRLSAGQAGTASNRARQLPAKRPRQPAQDKLTPPPSWCDIPHRADGRTRYGRGLSSARRATRRTSHTSEYLPGGGGPACVCGWVRRFPRRSAGGRREIIHQLRRARRTHARPN